MIDFLQNNRAILHYSLHALLPAIFGYTFFREFWRKAWVIMLATMLADLDHLLASPIFNPMRCSIGFHPLHRAPAIMIYGLMLFIPNKYAKIVGLGLLLHMFTDWVDCLLM